MFLPRFILALTNAQKVAYGLGLVSARVRYIAPTLGAENAGIQLLTIGVHDFRLLNAVAAQNPRLRHMFVCSVGGEDKVSPDG